MDSKIKDLLTRVEQFNSENAAEIEDFRVKMVGKKGELTALMEQFKSVAPELKREYGQKINALKQAILAKIDSLREAAAAKATADVKIDDMTRPGSAEQLGSRHPISLVKNEICEIFARLGYTIADGPEIEDDHHVFSALNFPPEHPARDMQDTFFVEKQSNEPNVKDLLLRTHTSSVQTRVMEKAQPPIRIICPGRVYRNEAISARAHCFFHQVEGLYIDKQAAPLSL